MTNQTSKYIRRIIVNHIVRMNEWDVEHNQCDPNCVVYSKQKHLFLQQRHGSVIYLAAGDRYYTSSNHSQLTVSALTTAERAKNKIIVQLEPDYPVVRLYGRIFISLITTLFTKSKNLIKYNTTADDAKLQVYLTAIFSK